MSHRSISAALLVLCCVPLAVAQQSPAQDGAAVSVVVQSLHAMGVTGNSFPVTDAVITGQVTVGTEPPRTITVTTKGADKLRVDTSDNGVTNKSVFRGVEGTHERGNTKRNMPATVALARSRMQYIPALLLAGEFFRQNTIWTYVGQEVLNGRITHHLAARRVYPHYGELVRPALEKASAIEILIDASDLTVTEIRYDSPSEADWRVSFSVRYRYRNYRQVEGLLVPSEVAYFLRDQLAWSLQLQTVGFNQGVPDAAFEVR